MKRIIRALAILALLVPTALAALVVSAQEVQRQRAAVIIANRTVIELRGPIAGYSAGERAQGSIARMINRLDNHT